MHPFERLRYVARGGVDDPAVIAVESADGLALLGHQPEALVTACRRLLDFHPECGPLWWLSARVLASGDPAVEARCCAGDLEDDPTPLSLAAALGDVGAGAAAILLPAEVAAAGLSIAPGRAVRALVPYMAFGNFARELYGAVDELEFFDQSDAEGAIEAAAVVLIEPVAAGPAGVLVRQVEPGSAVEDLVTLAEMAKVPIWAVCGVGRVLPKPLFDELRERLDTPPAAGRRGGRTECRLVPIEAIAQVVRPDGCHDARPALAHADCPSAAELLVRAR